MITMHSEAANVLSGIGKLGSMVIEHLNTALF